MRRRGGDLSQDGEVAAGNMPFETSGVVFSQGSSDAPNKIYSLILETHREDKGKSSQTGADIEGSDSFEVSESGSSWIDGIERDRIQTSL
jgi:hypothetical protein